MRKINIWRKQLAATLFDQPSVEPAQGKTDASLWRKFKNVGEVTQFHRGSALDVYREKVIAMSKQES